MVHSLSLSSIIFNLVKFDITIIDRFITMKGQANNDWVNYYGILL